MTRLRCLVVVTALLNCASAGVIYIYTSSYRYTECSFGSVNPAPNSNFKSEPLPGLKSGSDPGAYLYIQADGSTSKSSLSLGLSYPTAGRNDSRNAILPAAERSNANWQMDSLDAYYNGTYSFTLTPPSGNSSCPTLESKTLTNQFLRIGPSSRDGHWRQSYDKNPFYFAFGTGMADDQRCPYAANKAFVGFESSNDDLSIAQPWTLEAPKLDNGNWNLSGKLGQTEASYGNFLHYTVNTTGFDRGYSKSCNDQFTQHALTSRDTVTISASVGATDAKMDFSFTDSITGYVIKGAFQGKVWDKGAKLVMSGDKIATTGASKRVKPAQSSSSRVHRIIIICVVLVVVSLLLSCGWFCCCKRLLAKRRKTATVKKIDNGTVWHH